ncbi:uncharacterized protein EV154DRAFT_483573 [Mucor mucedo]|uniref:uncharacterized protein n=1 Tax=Mucor mucedo TaxID=29922 RepID=UPI002220FAEF|nr:uncharacterized protein EV154DRAFT_483573 [Mucor mucedo]KAI7889033.1 hypothetical protein EV154DRAFT_483573 [Mucor mucedo]
MSLVLVTPTKKKLSVAIKRLELDQAALVLEKLKNNLYFIKDSANIKLQMKGSELQIKKSQVYVYYTSTTTFWNKAVLTCCIIPIMIRFHAIHSLHHPDVKNWVLYSTHVQTWSRNSKNILLCSGDIEDDEYNLSSSLNHGLSSYLHDYLSAPIRMNANTVVSCQIPRRVVCHIILDVWAKLGIMVLIHIVM